IYSELTNKIINLAIKVHAILGPGFPERFYEKALAYEFNKNKVKCGKEKNMYIKYDNIALGIQRLDLVVEDKVILELKAVSEINESHTAQTVSYLKASGMKIGLILNFAKNKLEIKRVIV
ncbi:MAG: GxxExxY protein, partial [Candidatus Omnitrophota bacterium]